jgi:hypothetical protein
VKTGCGIDPEQERFLNYHSFRGIIRSAGIIRSCPEIISQNNQENEQAHPLRESLGRLVGASLGRNGI